MYLEPDTPPSLLASISPPRRYHFPVTERLNNLLDTPTTGYACPPMSPAHGLPHLLSVAHHCLFQFKKPKKETLPWTDELFINQKTALK